MKKPKVSAGDDSFSSALATLKVQRQRAGRGLLSLLTTLREQIAHVPAPDQPATTSDPAATIAQFEHKFANLESITGELFEKLTSQYNQVTAQLQNLSLERNAYALLHHLSMAMFTTEDLGQFCEQVLDAAIAVTESNLGTLEIVDEGRSFAIRLSRDQAKNKLEEDEEPEIARKIREAAKESKNSVRVMGILTGEEEELENPELSFPACYLAVPIELKEQVIGSILLADINPLAVYGATDQVWVEQLAEKLSFALEHAPLTGEPEKDHGQVLEDLRERFKFDEILGSSPRMVELLRTVADVAATDATVLIEGESGTGKELLARAIHFNSRRSKKPFVPINCAAIPESLLESELFGYEKGAFTGAVARKPGKFEHANGGTVFLDEIGEMSPLLQVKLLRFLQAHEFEPLGSTRIRQADLRIIAATNRDPQAMVKEGKFREDLFYRINVINLKLPPLRERKSDIALLAEYFVNRFARTHKKKLSGLAADALTTLNRYHFPGNVRELENAIERAVILAKGDLIKAEDLPVQLIQPAGGALPTKIAENYIELKSLRKKTVEEIERNFIINLLGRYGANISHAARAARMHRVELQRMIKKHQIKLSSLTPNDKQQ